MNTQLIDNLMSMKKKYSENATFETIANIDEKIILEAILEHESIKYSTKRKWMREILIWRVTIHTAIDRLLKLK